jgi:hypothetical protein
VIESTRSGYERIQSGIDQSLMIDEEDLENYNIHDISALSVSFFYAVQYHPSFQRHYKKMHQGFHFHHLLRLMEHAKVLKKQLIWYFKCL